MKVLKVSEGGWAVITSDHLKVVVDYGFGDAIKTIVNDNFRMIRCYWQPGRFQAPPSLYYSSGIQIYMYNFINSLKPLCKIIMITFLGMGRCEGLGGV